MNEKLATIAKQLEALKAQIILGDNAKSDEALVEDFYKGVAAIGGTRAA